MKTKLMTIVCMTISFSSFADVCPSLQKAEANAVSLAYYNGKASEVRSFCYSISKAVNSTAGIASGIDGLLMSSIEYCAEGKSVKSTVLSAEVAAALKSVKGCYSLMN